MSDSPHYHRCPYCKILHPCVDTCYPGRVTNLICPDCKAKWQGEMEDIKKHGNDWHNQPG